MFSDERITNQKTDRLLLPLLGLQRERMNRMPHAKVAKFAMQEMRWSAAFTPRHAQLTGRLWSFATPLTCGQRSGANTALLDPFAFFA
jgi:hypothetical protein